MPTLSLSWSTTLSPALFIQEKKQISYQSAMGKVKVAILVAMCIISLLFNVEAIPSPSSSSLETEIEAKLKLLNKPPVKTIKSEDGDIIDCVDIYKQPAFDHPALKNHTIKMMADDSSTKDGSKSETVIFQRWQKSGSCPKGTIPIRRILKEDLLRASSLHRFGQKPPEGTNFNFSNPNANNEFIPQNRSSAYLVELGYNYIGAQADINVYNPKVDLPDDFTTAQIWLKNDNNPNFESVESGWMRDSYRSTGCFDLTCPGFIQTGQVALGAAIAPVSSRFGPQYEINIGIFLEPNLGNWYVKVRNNVPVGYFPGEILGSLRHSAIIVEWGGQVSSTNIKQHETPHTGTQMGSGGPASGRYGNACYMRNVRIMDYSLIIKYPEHPSTMAEEPYCYSSLNQADYGKEPIFYFGGPGRSPPYCP
ncbi:hypothetical protein RJT34_09536 [Clitoria ternatea]|uniref:Neprosin PEP catalytic domain-containing protein n=1 Tax=Clitoria ternatea TaxID=43366 RepID=A0AAN9PUP4_CLITE